MPGFHGVRALSLHLYKKAGKDGQNIAGHTDLKRERGSSRQVPDPLTKYGRDGVIRTLDPKHPISFFILLESFQNFTLDFSKLVFT
ncbi:MAG: putative phage integrase [Conexibacter sp.]|nr:putative phage integrase [Conexibacter sp.]